MQAGREGILNIEQRISNVEVGKIKHSIFLVQYSLSARSGGDIKTQLELKAQISASCSKPILNELFLSLYFLAASIKLTNKGAGRSTVLFNSG